MQCAYERRDPDRQKIYDAAHAALDAIRKVHGLAPWEV